MPSDTPPPSGTAADIELLCAWIEARMAYPRRAGTLHRHRPTTRSWCGRAGFGYADVASRVAASATTPLPDRVGHQAVHPAPPILLLRDAGKLQLDDPVEYATCPGSTFGGAAPDAAPITIRHLLTHTSGLPREAAFPYWTDGRFPSRAQVRETLPRQETAYPADTPLEVLQPGT